MPRSRSPLRTLAAAVGGLALALVVVFAADAAYGRRSVATPDPTDPPVTTPTATPAEPTPSVEPTAAPPTPRDIAVPLKNLTGHDVSVEIEDQAGHVASAQSGTPGDGMSIRWFDVRVENIDADTLRVVWIGLPRDEIIRLGVSKVDGQVRLRFVQDAPPPNSDAVGFDRILELSFDEPVRSEDVLASMQESLDTQD